MDLISSPIQLAVGFLSALAIAAISYRLRFLTLDGSVASVLLGTLIFGLGGFQWAIPLLVFFFTSNILSHLSRRNSDIVQHARRNAVQVMANGGVGGLLVLLSILLPAQDWFVLYLGSLAAATADTWGTEIGIRASGRTVLISTFRSVQPGTSGAVSLAGSLGGIVGATAIGLTGMLMMNPSEWTLPHVVVSAGVAGSICDSLIGAILQVRYQCSICGKLVESAKSCHGAVVHVGGFRWVTNDTVNLICTVAGGFVAFLLVW